MSSHGTTLKKYLSFDCGPIQTKDGFNLDNINIKVEDGQFVAVVGHVGSGKVKSYIVKLLQDDSS